MLRRGYSEVDKVVTVRARRHAIRDRRGYLRASADDRADSPSVSPPHPDCAAFGWPKDGFDCPPLPLPEPEKPCGECDGTGRIACHVCGNGTMECDECFGTGDRLTSYRVGDSLLATSYIALLRAYGVTHVYQPRGAGWPYYFVGPGFTGLVIPCFENEKENQ